MRVEMVRADPTGNATILVLTPVEPARRAPMAEALMARSRGWAEQVGFVSRTPEGDSRLDMMGGEFCGNAALSLTAYLADRQGLPEAEMRLSVSGAEESVRCAVRREGDGYLGTVTMPRPLSVREEDFRLGGETLRFWTACLPGITHVLVPLGELTRTQAEYAAPLWAQAAEADALGVLLFDERALRMEPLVYVPATRTAVWERGCASGTAAVGACLAVRRGESAVADVRQPGGVIGVSATYVGGEAKQLSITGRVRLLGADEAEI